MVLNQDEAKKILDKVMDISTADETEAHGGSYRSALTRFADNHIHQNVSEEGVSLSVIAVLGKRMGTATPSKLDDESIKRTVSNAIEIARFAPPDDELLPRLGPQEYREVKSYDPAVDRITPMERARSPGRENWRRRPDRHRAAAARLPARDGSPPPRVRRSS